MVKSEGFLKEFSYEERLTNTTSPINCKEFGILRLIQGR